MPPPSRVFITGALGFIGSSLAARYRERGVDVRGVDMRADEPAGVVAGDVSAPGRWQEDAAGCDVVIHTAAIVSNVANLETSWRMNVHATRMALDAAVGGGAGRFVHLSSVRTFSDRGFPDGVDERHPVRTDGNAYVDTKVASEQVVLQAHAGVEIACTVIRPGDVYGPRSRPWTILPVEMIGKNQFLLPAMGRGVFSPVYIDNLLDGIALAAEGPEGVGQVFTISDGVAVTTREFFGHYCRMLGVRGPRVLPTGVAAALAEVVGRVERARGRESEASASTARYLARTGTYSIAKARRVLGYEPRVSLSEGMRRTEAWLRAEGLV
jgi:nucleoside-diphosphate-sugar epimerase